MRPYKVPCIPPLSLVTRRNNAGRKGRGGDTTPVPDLMRVACFPLSSPPLFCDPCLTASPCFLLRAPSRSEGFAAVAPLFGRNALVTCGTGAPGIGSPFVPVPAPACDTNGQRKKHSETHKPQSLSRPLPQRTAKTGSRQREPGGGGLLAPARMSDATPRRMRPRQRSG